MKKQIAKMSLLTLCAAAILAVPALSRAQDTTNSTPAASGQTMQPKLKKLNVLPFRGKLTAVDTNAMTLAVGDRTFQITSDTKITKDGQPAVLEDGVVGEPVTGSYKKAEDGKLDAATVHFVAKASPKKKEAAAGN